MKALRLISRVFVGVLFLFSGFVKAIDPLGSTYKFIDYFGAWQMEFLAPIALPLAILLSTSELLMGFCMFTGLRMKVTSWVVTGFMTFFTIITFVVALTNPVTDCGCFGDALILTNWQTFWKNIVMLVPTLFILWQRKNFPVKYWALVEWNVITAFAIVGIFVSVFGYKHLPIIDFRPYNIGTNIMEKMTIPANAPQDVYKNVFFYKNKNTGEVQEFDDSNYPWQDTVNWAFDHMEDPILVEKGYTPAIHDFSITNEEGVEITNEVLNYKGYTIIYIGQKLGKADRKALRTANRIMFWADRHQIPFYFLTASTDDEIMQAKNELLLDFEFHTCDEITLKTIVRSNPGLLLLKDGTIINKWHYNDIPGFDDLEERDLLAYSIETHQKQRNRLLVWSLIASLIFVVSLGGNIFNKYN